MTAPAPAAAGTGRNVANTAYHLIVDHEPGHIRYQEGGDSSYSDPDPRVLDCSSFVDWVFYHAVGHPIVPGGRSTAATLRGWIDHPLDSALAANVKGALQFVGTGHVEVSLGNGNTAAAHTDGIPIEKQVDVEPGRGFDGGGTMPGVNYADAATTPEAAAALSKIVGYPVTVSDPNEFGAPTNAGGAAGAGGVAVDAFNEFVNVYNWGFKPAVGGEAFYGPRALMNDTPILPYISNLLSATFRSFCSAPNGDFMAWFPDYFGLFGDAAKMNVKSIELQDFTVEWQDQHIVTHQFVVGVPQGFVSIDGGTGKVTGGDTDQAWMTTTGGVATMDYPEIFKPIFGKPADKQFITDYVSRFGARPDMQQMPTIQSGSLSEFFMALYLFMQRWASQFQAQVPMTFMPELWPGMLLALPEFNFQAYIAEVQHSFKFGAGGGFQTSASICAPSKTDETDPIMNLLPIGGKAGQDNIAGAAATTANNLPGFTGGGAGGGSPVPGSS